MIYFGLYLIQYSRTLNTWNYNIYHYIFNSLLVNFLFPSRTCALLLSVNHIIYILTASFLVYFCSSFVESLGVLFGNLWASFIYSKFMYQIQVKSNTFEPNIFESIELDIEVDQIVAENLDLSAKRSINLIF